ncbi:peptidoglycan-binding domain-containing protein [Streptomyces sp. T-3]|nr:peptidoglycan-binding domain-containing protein [Streptomyces sp. T-3]
MLREGDSGSEVRELQQRLKETYLYAGPTDGQYDTLVKDAVQRFQWSEGIESDEQGVYGPETRRTLESQTDEP